MGEREELGGLSRTEGLAWGGLLRTHARLTQALDEELREAHGLPLTWYDALRQLALAPEERLRLSSLAERVLLTQSGLSRLVNRLEDEGLVRRAFDPDDGRATLAVLTPGGRERLLAAHPTHLEGIRRHFLAGLNEAELRSLAKIWDAIGRAGREPPNGVEGRRAV